MSEQEAEQEKNSSSRSKRRPARHKSDLEQNSEEDCKRLYSKSYDLLAVSNASNHTQVLKASSVCSFVDARFHSAAIDLPVAMHALKMGFSACISACAWEICRTRDRLTSVLGQDRQIISRGSYFSDNTVLSDYQARRTVSGRLSTQSTVSGLETRRYLNDGQARYSFIDPPSFDVLLTQLRRPSVSHEDFKRNALDANLQTDADLLPHYLTGMAKAPSISYKNPAKTPASWGDLATEELSNNNNLDEAREWAMMSHPETGALWYKFDESDLQRLGSEQATEIQGVPEYQKAKDILTNLGSWIPHLNAGIPEKDKTKHHISPLALEGRPIEKAKANNHRVQLHVGGGGNQVINISKSYLRLFHIGTRSSNYFGTVRDVFMEERCATVEEEQLLVLGPSLQHFAGKQRREKGKPTRPNQGAGGSEAIYRYEGNMCTEQVSTKVLVKAPGVLSENCSLDQYIQGISFARALKLDDSSLQIRSPNLLLQASAAHAHGAAPSKPYAYIKSAMANRSLTLYGNTISVKAGKGAEESCINLEKNALAIRAKKITLEGDMNFKGPHLVTHSQKMTMKTDGLSIQ
jgi:hypothetical protein